MQGRVACEINSGDELVATEMIFAGVLSELEPEEAVALLSALVFQVGPCCLTPAQGLQRTKPSRDSSPYQSGGRLDESLRATSTYLQALRCLDMMSDVEAAPVCG